MDSIPNEIAEFYLPFVGIYRINLIQWEAFQTYC